MLNVSLQRYIKIILLFRLKEKGISFFERNLKYQIENLFENKLPM